jgi:hypothetical protein
MHHSSLRDFVLLSLEYERARVAFYKVALASLQFAHEDRQEWSADLRQAESRVARLLYRCRELDLDPTMVVRGREHVRAAAAHLTAALASGGHGHEPSIVPAPGATAAAAGMHAAGDWELRLG